MAPLSRRHEVGGTADHHAAYWLEISDDGRGGQHEEGVGMRSIRARAEALGGTAVRKARRRRASPRGWISAGTVRNYLSEAIVKLGAANRIEAAQIARAKGWL